VKQVVFRQLSNFRICGVPDLIEIAWRKRADKVGEAVHDRYEVITKGSALREVLKMRSIDHKTLYSNHAPQVFEVFGIEAVRKLYLLEMRSSMSSVDENYFHTTIDSMMHKGRITAVNRYGIENVGPLSRGSNEMPSQTFTKASIKCQGETLSGVSSNTILGQNIPLGTGSHTVYWDQDKYYELVKNNAKTSTKTREELNAKPTSIDSLMQQFSSVTNQNYQIEDV
jgi:DNA-directed RNA polymerase subunit A"